MKITKYETNLAKHKFLHKTENLEFNKKMDNIENNLIIVYPEIKFQSVIGFGGAFTESACYCFSQLSEENKQNLINDYFSENGINYSLGRICIESSDFSLKSYSYSYKDDLSDFSIDHDKKYIIPFIKEVLNLKKIYLFATPWSPPAFMKNNNSLYHGGKLLNKYKQLWADYLVRYIDAYKNNGINIQYITTQNEPNASQKWESCTYSGKEEQEIIKNHIIPTFIKNKIDTQLLIWDHNKENIVYRAEEVFSDKQVENFVAGIGYHYYSGDYFENINIFSQLYKNKIIVHTEGCTGYEKLWIRKLLREVPNAEIYAHDIIGDLNAGTNGYIDWNLLLDFNGGPTYIHNYCNSPIMLNKKCYSYKKTLSYYYIGHFSKFIKKHSTRIAYSKYTDKLEVTSFINKDGSIVVIILNRLGHSQKIRLCLYKEMYEDYIDGHSIITFVIK